MENIEKENKRLKALIIILVITLLGVGVYHYYVTYIKTNDTNKEVVDNTTNDSTVVENSTKEENKPTDNNIDTSNENTAIEIELDDEYSSKIYKRYWYDKGMIFFFRDGMFFIGKHQSDGGYNGKVKKIEKDLSSDYPQSYVFNAVFDACTDPGCMYQTNGYNLEVKMEYAVVSSGEVVTINSIVKTEDGTSEHLTMLENKTYQFAGNNWEEVAEFVKKLNN